jgi:hypothetical protein
MGILNSISAKGCSVIGAPQKQVSRAPAPRAIPCKPFFYPKVLKRTVSCLSRAAEMKQQAAHSDQSRSAARRGTQLACLQHRVGAKAVHRQNRFNLEILPGSPPRLAVWHDQLLLPEAGSAATDVWPAVAGRWDCKSLRDIVTTYSIITAAGLTVPWQ